MSHHSEIMSKADEVKLKANEAALAVRADYSRTHSGTPAPAPVPVPPVTLGIGYPPLPGEIPQISQIDSKFLWLADRDPTQVASKRSALTAGKTAFKYLDQYTFGGMVSEVQDGWDGRTAESFREQFLLKMSKAYDLQMDLLDELTAALNAVEQINYDSKRDVVDIADKTITALETIRRTAEAPPDSGTIMFAIVGGIITIGSAGLGGGVGFAIMAAGVSVSAAVKASGSKPADSKLTIHGNSVGLVLDSMFAAIGKVERTDNSRCAAIARGLNSDLTVTEDKDNFALLSPPRPTVATDSGDMSPSRD